MQIWLKASAARAQFMHCKGAPPRLISAQGSSEITWADVRGHGSGACAQAGQGQSHALGVGWGRHAYLEVSRSVGASEAMPIFL